MLPMIRELNTAIVDKVTATLSNQCKVPTPAIRYTDSGTNFNFYISRKADDFTCLTYFRVEYRELDFSLYFEDNKGALNRIEYQNGFAVAPMLLALSQLIKNKILNPQLAIPVEREETGISLDGILTVAPQGEC